MATKKTKTAAAKPRKRKKATASQLKGLEKGRKIQEVALRIMKKSGTHTIPAKQVSNKTLPQAMKEAKRAIDSGRVKQVLGLKPEKL